jgi:hypothetical protein
LSSECDEEDDDSGVGLPGRKKGETLEKKYQDKSVLTLAYNACALKFNAKRILAVPRQTYERSIVEMEETYEVEKEIMKIETVRWRM